MAHRQCRHEDGTRRRPASPQVRSPELDGCAQGGKGRPCSSGLWGSWTLKEDLLFSPSGGRNCFEQVKLLFDLGVGSFFCLQFQPQLRGHLLPEAALCPLLLKPVPPRLLSFVTCLQLHFPSRLQISSNNTCFMSHPRPSPPTHKCAWCGTECELAVERPVGTLAPRAL